MTLILQDDLLIGKGYKRLCYQHPSDTTKIIKIKRPNSKSDDNLIESIYYDYLIGHSKSFTHITQCFGWIKTSQGEGLVFEKVINFDGSQPLTLEQVIRNKVLPQKTVENLIEELRQYLQENQILFADVVLGNIFCQALEGNQWKLIIFDGLGSARNDFRFKLRLLCPLYNRYKINIQWQRFLANYRKLLAT